MSLREAATAAGTSKSTILRAIQSGRMSGPRTDEGGYAIDPAELFRVYPPMAESDVAAERTQDRSERQAAPSRGTAEEVELRLRNARLEGELVALKSLVDAEKRRADDMREDRDRWHAQAERFALAAPIAVSVPTTQQQPAPQQSAPLSRGLMAWVRRTA